MELALEDLTNNNSVGGRVLSAGKGPKSGAHP